MKRKKKECFLTLALPRLCLDAIFAHCLKDLGEVRATSREMLKCVDDFAELAENRPDLRLEVRRKANRRKRNEQTERVYKNIISFTYYNENRFPLFRLRDLHDICSKFKSASFGHRYEFELEAENMAKIRQAFKNEQMSLFITASASLPFIDIVAYFKGAKISHIRAFYAPVSAEKRDSLVPALREIGGVEYLCFAVSFRPKGQEAFILNVAELVDRMEIRDLGRKPVNSMRQLLQLGQSGSPSLIPDIFTKRCKFLELNSTNQEWNRSDLDHIAQDFMGSQSVGAIMVYGSSWNPHPARFLTSQTANNHDYVVDGLTLKHKHFSC